MRAARLLALALAAAPGCRFELAGIAPTGGGGDGAAAPDLSPAPDLAGADLAGADLAVVDLAAVDLATAIDAAAAPDLAVSGMLSIQQALSPLGTSLTMEGTADWAQYALGAVGDIN